MHQSVTRVRTLADTREYTRADTHADMDLDGTTRAPVHMRLDSNPNCRAHLRAHGQRKRMDFRVHELRDHGAKCGAHRLGSGSRLPVVLVVHNGVC